MGAERAQRQVPKHDDDREPTGGPPTQVTASSRSGDGAIGSIRRAAVGLDELLDETSERIQPAPTSVQPKLEVGAADDTYEREADATADRVMSQIAPGQTRFDPPPTSRVARQAEVGAEGGEISGDLAQTITSSSGSALPDGVRSKMESGFGADFSGVRVHQDSPAASRIQARAFTHGSDVHFAPGQFQPDSTGGQHLLAHELTHVVQQGGGINRFMWDSTRFSAETKHWTRKSTAQKEIGPLLDAFNAKYPPDTWVGLDEATAKQALADLESMRKRAEAYVGAKTTEEDDGSRRTKKNSKSNRVEGMKRFVDHCTLEMMFLRNQVNSAKRLAGGVGDVSIDNIDVSGDEGLKKLQAHYEGDSVSCFRKLGTLIDAAAPIDGDSASIDLTVKIPVSPGVFVSLGFGASAERDGNVDVSVNVRLGAGGSAGVAEIAGELGGYLTASAPTGADAAELMSYALFRRCRQSKIVPREVTNFMWGRGDAGSDGWGSAEAWSLGVENRLLESEIVDGEEKNENFVESGAFAKLAAEVGLGDKVANLGVEAEGYTGTRIDATSLTARKGGAGATNLKSGGPKFNLFGPDKYEEIGKQPTTRGVTQKNVGRSTHGFRLSAEVGNDFIGGAIEFAMRWLSDGAHGKKTYELAEADLGGSVSFTMPGNELVAGGIGNFIPPLIESVNKVIARANNRVADADDNPARDTGAVGHSLFSAATAIAELGKSPGDWALPTQLDDSALDGFGGSSTTLTLGLNFNLADGEFEISLSQEKSGEFGKAAQWAQAATDTTDAVKMGVGVSLDISKSSRILAVAYEGGKWVFKWAGGEEALTGTP